MIWCIITDFEQKYFKIRHFDRVFTAAVVSLNIPESGLFADFVN